MPNDVPNRGFEGGEGASAADVKRGFLDGGPKTLPPERDPANYKARWSVGPDNPMYPYSDYDSHYNPGEPENGASFRARDRKAPGLLDRPWPPNDRG